MFFNKDEISARILRRWNMCGQKQDGPLSIHKNTRCELPGFVAIGPLFQGNKSYGMSWFDIRVQENSPLYDELNGILKQVCIEWNLYYEA